MTKVNFYHLTQTPLGKALPRLLEKVVSAGMRAVVLAENDEKVDVLNSELWTYTTKFFLPHGSKKDGFVERQPIYLTSSISDNPNGSNVLAFIGNVDPGDVKEYDKCLYMFDGNEQTQLETARKRWKEYKDAGFETTYWQQTAKGAWEEGGK